MYTEIFIYIYIYVYMYNHVYMCIERDTLQ